jgi:predicted CoA-binding protein
MHGTAPAAAWPGRRPRGLMDVVARGDAETIERVLRHEVWAVVGLTPHEWRPAYGVARFLQGHGKRIVPVNPTGDAVHGVPGYRTLADIPFPVDVVDVFRRSADAGEHVDEAIKAGAKAVWLQLGVIDEPGADRAAAAGLDVIMDHCPAIEWPAYGPRQHWGQG